MTLLPAILVTFAILLAVIAGMAIGVMNGRKPISGSCGGLNSNLTWTYSMHFMSS